MTWMLENIDRVGIAIIQHIQIVIVSLMFSLVLACCLTLLAYRYPRLEKYLRHFFSILYSIPSLALFALFIPWSGLGLKTTIIVLVLYNQFILFIHFITAIHHVNPSLIEAAAGLGLTKNQILIKVLLPLSKQAFFAAIRLAIISTIGIATIAASINAGGLGDLLLDGLRTMNTSKIVVGSVTSFVLAIGMNQILKRVEENL